MRKIQTYLDDAIRAGIVKNDAELAQRLGVARSTVSRWREGDRHPDEDQAAALACLLGKPDILAESMAARAKKPENRATWERAAHALRMTGALGMGAGVVLLASSPAVDAAPLLGFGLSGLCVMLSRRAIRQQRAKPRLGTFRRWMQEQRADRVQQKRINASRQKANALALNASLPSAHARA